MSDVSHQTCLVFSQELTVSTCKRRREYVFFQEEPFDAILKPIQAQLPTHVPYVKWKHLPIMLAELRPDHIVDVCLVDEFLVHEVVEDCLHCFHLVCQSLEVFYFFELSLVAEVRRLCYLLHNQQGKLCRCVVQCIVQSFIRY